MQDQKWIPTFLMVFAFSMLVALLDDFPSEANVKHLVELPKQGYVVYRLIG